MPTGMKELKFSLCNRQSAYFENFGGEPRFLDDSGSVRAGYWTVFFELEPNGVESTFLGRPCTSGSYIDIMESSNNEEGGTVTGVATQCVAADLPPRMIDAVHVEVSLKLRSGFVRWLMQANLDETNVFLQIYREGPEPLFSNDLAEVGVRKIRFSFQAKPNTKNLTNQPRRVQEEMQFIRYLVMAVLVVLLLEFISRTLGFH